MDDFSEPLLADSVYNSIGNNNNNKTIMHHHKDHMLAAGSTPSTTAFLYDTPARSQPTTKSEMTMAKSDYSTFTTSIQQSALLDHRTVAIDANLDAGVSLGALCDLKFSGGTPSMLSNNLINDNANSSFKDLESNQIMSDLQKLNTTVGTTFTNILFNRDAIQTNQNNNNATINNNCVQHQHHQHYVALKSNEVQNTAEHTQHHYLPNATNTVETSTPASHMQSPSNELNARSMSGTADSSLLDYGIPISSSSATSSSAASTHTVHHRLNSSTESTKHHNGLDGSSTVTVATGSMVNENHTRTSTNTTIVVTPTTSSIITNDANHTASNITTAASIVGSNMSRSTVHSIHELTASSCPPNSSTTSSLNTHPGNNSNNMSTAATSATAKSVFIIINENNYQNSNNNNEPTQQLQSQITLQQHSQQQQQQQQDVATTSSSRQLQQQQQQQHLQQQPQSHHIQQQHQQRHAQQQLQHHQQQLHNPSTLSSDSNDSLSSSDEYIEMESTERAGYQDTTSSHSQHSANGGGGGGATGNGPSSNPNSSNPGVSLINGVVTLNSQNSVALTGGAGSNNGGSSASSASGTYMSLLPPNVGATNSPVTHLGGVSALSGGTSASASGTAPDVIDFKHLFEELCPVCGDKVSGYHYGLLTCESCKGFFKRTVQNKKVYTCVAERSCHIDKTQRKRCPYCRFQKCLEVGMKLEAVRADRMRGGRNKFGPMYKRDRARKLQVMRQRQIALQALRTSMGTGEIKPTPLSPGYQQAYTNMNIKQEIQIPQVSSLTQSPDSSPSPIAIALGQVNANSGVIATPMNGSSGAGGGVGGSGGGGGGGGSSGSGSNSGNNNNSNNTSDGINRVGSGSGGGSGNCHETGTGSLQSASDSKLCFDSGTHPSSTADSIIEPLRVSPMIREFVQSIDDREWQTQLFALLQKQTYNQVEVDLFELMCKVLDQNLFSQVDWARNTVFFKDLKVDDQMKLLQHSWSDMLVLDHLHQRIHNGLPDETQLNNGQFFNLLSLGLLGVPQLADYFNELQSKLQDLKFDMGDYVCMKFLILLNPDVRGIINKKTVLQGHENVQAALLDYTLTCYPSVTDKFRRLLSILPDIHAMAARGEEHLYSKHCAGSAPTQTLLMEMLHAKRKV